MNHFAVKYAADERLEPVPDTEDRLVFLANRNAPCTIGLRADSLLLPSGQYDTSASGKRLSKCVARGTGSADSGRQSLTNAVERR